MIDKYVFSSALNDLRLIKHLIENYNGDYDTLTPNINGRRINNDIIDVDFNHITFAVIRTDKNKVSIPEKVDVYDDNDIYIGLFSYEELEEYSK